MQHSNPRSFFEPQPKTAHELVLQEARRLHRTATGGKLAQALPVLRRLLAAEVIRGLSLPQLSRSTELVQRKHLLQMLAIEAGFRSWQDYQPELAALPATELVHFDIARQQAGHLNLWFASTAEAEQHQARFGGKVLKVGQQAVLFEQGGVTA